MANRPTLDQPLGFQTRAIPNSLCQCSAARKNGGTIRMIAREHLGAVVPARAVLSTAMATEDALVQTTSGFFGGYSSAVKTFSTTSTPRCAICEKVSSPAKPGVWSVNALRVL